MNEGSVASSDPKKWSRDYATGMLDTSQINWTRVILETSLTGNKIFLHLWRLFFHAVLDPLFFENFEYLCLGLYVLCVDDTAGLSPQQIKDKFDLPYAPTHVTDVKPPQGTTIRKVLLILVILEEMEVERSLNFKGEFPMIHSQIRGQFNEVFSRTTRDEGDR